MERKKERKKKVNQSNVKLKIVVSYGILCQCGNFLVTLLINNNSTSIVIPTHLISRPSATLFI